MNTNKIDQMFALALSREPYFASGAFERQFFARLKEAVGPKNRYRIVLLALGVICSLLPGMMILTSSGGASELHQLTEAVANVIFSLSLWLACLASLFFTTASLFGTNKYLRFDV
jgi:hypothetical protein